jgi:NADH:ubiquinone oxidoreductase subunit 4 (subunit M)
VLTYCYKSDLTPFANQGEIEIALKQVERAHPDWSEKQRMDYLSYHSFNILVFQRAGMEHLVQLKPKSNKSAKTKQVFSLIGVLAAALLLGFSSPLMALIYKTYQNTDLPIAMLLAGAFPLLGIYIFTRFGIQIFPAGIVSSAQWLTWVIIGLLTALSFIFIIMQSPERFIAFLSSWIQLVCYLGIMTSFAGSPNIWKAKTFAGSFIFLLGGCLCLTGLVYLWKQIKDQTLVDIIDFKIGALKKAPIIGCTFAILLAAILGCPGFFNSIGIFLLASSALQFGLIPALLLGIGFILITISCYRILNIIFGESFSTPTLSDLKFSQIILVFIIIMPVVILGLFPNLMLSWYMPSTSAISELIQTTLVR